MRKVTIHGKQFPCPSCGREVTAGSTGQGDEFALVHLEPTCERYMAVNTKEDLEKYLAEVPSKQEETEDDLTRH